MIIGIVAVDNDWGIGKDNDLLFHIPQDMLFFKSKTLNNAICMGRKTFESLPNQEPLKDRQNIILTSSDTEYPGCICLNSLEQLLEWYTNECTSDLYIIGGGEVYQKMLPYYDKIFVTKVDATKDADTFFPNLDNLQFTIVSKSDKINTGKYVIQFLEYGRRPD